MTTAVAEPPTTAIIGTPPQPTWHQLNSQQQDILSPVAGDWDKMDNIRRKKWLGIADRYPNMKQDDQQRMQNRMREWAKLTPEQRSKIRTSYKDFSQLPPEQKKVVKRKWDAYSNLHPEQRQHLREGGKSSKLLATPVVITGAATNGPIDSSTIAEGSTSQPPAANTSKH